MAKRILNMTPKELINLSKEEIIDAIAGSEGRVLASETIGITIPLLSDVTNAEFAASMGADMILLNMFDVQDPVILGLPQSDRQETVRKVKQLTGRMVGINLEPVDDAAASENAETLWAMSAGRYATVENAALAQKMGVDMIVLTGNPGNGVSNDAIVSSLRAISAEIGDKIVLAAGKMHASGVIGEVQLINVNSKMRKIEIIFKAKKAHLPLGENIIFSKDIDSLDLQYFMRLCRI